MLAHAIDPQEFTSVFHVVENDKPTEGKVKISAFRRLFGGFDQIALKKSVGILDTLSDSLEFIKETDLDPKTVSDFKSSFNKLIPLFAVMDDMLDKEFLDLFELDDPVSEQIINNYFAIRDLSLDIYEHLKLYQEIDVADKEFEQGKTISHEELFNDSV